MDAIDTITDLIKEVLDAIELVDVEQINEDIDVALTRLAPLYFTVANRLSAAVERDVLARAKLIAQIREEFAMSTAEALALVNTTAADVARAFSSAVPSSK
jgi:hypothetical protein